MSTYTPPLAPPDHWIAARRVATSRHRSTLLAIIDEVDRAERLHPDWPADVIYAAAIVGEECGELVQTALQAVFEGGDVDAIRTEALHTAATAIRLIASLPNVKQEARP